MCSLYSYTFISFRLARTEAGIAHICNVVLFIYYFFFCSFSSYPIFKEVVYLYPYTRTAHTTVATTTAQLLRLSAFTFRPRISFCTVRLSYTHIFRVAIYNKQPHVDYIVRYGPYRCSTSLF